MAGSGGRVWWPALAMVSVLLATGLGVGLGLAQAPRAIVYSGGDIFATPVASGQLTDFPAWLGAPGGQTITLVRIGLIPVAGYATPRLVRYGAFRGNGLDGDTGWPPKVGVHPLLAVGTRSFNLSTPDTMVVYQLLGTGRAPQYAWAGLRVTYELAGAEFTSPSAQGGVLCVRGLAPGGCVDNGVNAVRAAWGYARLPK